MTTTNARPPPPDRVGEREVGRTRVVGCSISRFRDSKNRMNTKTTGMMRSAPLIFAPENGLAYFEELVWKTVEVESVFSAAYRISSVAAVDAGSGSLPPAGSA